MGPARMILISAMAAAIKWRSGVSCFKAIGMTGKPKTISTKEVGFSTGDVILLPSQINYRLATFFCQLLFMTHRVYRFVANCQKRVLAGRG